MFMIQELISSMTQAEKRYFSAGMKKTSQHYEVYTCILDTGYHINKDLEDFLGEKTYFPIITTIKSQLYNLILKSLRNFHRTHDLDLAIKNGIADVEVLRIKHLYIHAIKRLNKIKEMCVRHERFGYLCEIISLEIALLYEYQNPIEFQMSIKLAWEEFRSYTHLGKEQFLYKMNYLNSVLILENNLDLIQTIVTDPMAKRTLQTESANYFYLHTQLLWAIELSQLDVAESCANSLMAMLDKHPKELQENKRQYLDIIFSCGLVFVYAKKEEHVKRFLRLIFEVPEDQKNIEIRKWERYIYLASLEKLMFNPAADLHEEMVFFDQYSSKSNDILAQNISLFFVSNSILRKDYRMGLKWCGFILNEKRATIHLKNYNKAIFSELYIFYVTEKIDLFDRKIDGIRKRIKRLQFGEMDEQLIKSLQKSQNPASELWERIKPSFKTQF
jgi:hypothetical protein